MVVPSVFEMRQRMSDIVVPCFDVGEWLQRNRGGGTTEVGAPASGIRRGVAYALTPQLKTSFVVVLGLALNRHGNK
jgi:hypothetical protein